MKKRAEAKTRAYQGTNEAWEKTPLLKDTAAQIKAARKSRDTDDPVDLILYDPFAIRLTGLFIKAGWSANAVTVTSLAAGVIGSLFFYPQNRWINLIGIVIVIFAAVLDCCDGQVARLTHTSSEFGRILDGMVDIVNFLAIYIVLGLRMMKEPIPFTETPWSFWIWIVAFVTMLCHASQARIADYYRGLHLFFLEGSNPAYLTRADKLEAELKALPKDTPLYRRIYRRLYLIYTRNQERSTPRAQRLLAALEERGSIPEGLAEEYCAQSRGYVKLATVALTYNIRTWTLFILLMLNLHPYYFPFVILLLEAVRILIIVRYEGIAKRIYAKYLTQDAASGNVRDAAEDR